MSDTKYIEDPDDIRLNDDQELQQILGNPPGWLLRWGITFIAIGMAVFLTLGWLIKYPDVIMTPVILTTPQPPIKVFAESAGKLIEFNIENNQEVKKNDTLAILDNSANLRDVEILNRFLFNMPTTFTRKEMIKLRIPRDLQLGTLQTAYADFSKNFDEYVFFLKNNNTYPKIRNLEKQIEDLEELGSSLTKQMSTLQEVIDISKNEWDRNESLKKIGGVSETELENSKIAYLRNKRQKETLGDQIISNNLVIEKTRMQIIEMLERFKENRSSGGFSIQEDIENMKSQVERWRKTFLIQAPISGRVSLSQFRSAQQFINQSEELLTIVPDTATSIIAKGILPSVGSGKVEIGMRANIRLTGYSYQEFGSVECQVTNISLVPSKDGFVVELSVPRPIVTAYDKTIPFQQEMQGMANIITEDRRILERVFDRILSIIFND